MDRGAWWATVNGVTKNQTQLNMHAFPILRVLSSELVLHIRWPKLWSFSFSISPSNEYSELITLRIDLFDLLESPRDSQESSPIPQFKSISSSVLSFLFGLTLTST